MDEIWTIDQLGDYLHFTRGQVYTLTRARSQAGPNPVPILKINGNVRFSKKAIEAWLQRLQGGEQ